MQRCRSAGVRCRSFARPPLAGAMLRCRSRPERCRSAASGWGERRWDGRATSHDIVTSHANIAERCRSGPERCRNIVPEVGAAERLRSPPERCRQVAPRVGGAHREGAGHKENINFLMCSRIAARPAPTRDVASDVARGPSDVAKSLPSSSDLSDIAQGLSDVARDSPTSLGRVGNIARHRNIARPPTPPPRAMSPGPRATSHAMLAEVACDIAPPPNDIVHRSNDPQS